MPTPAAPAVLPSRVLSNDELGSYQRDGFLCCRGLLAVDDLAGIRDQIAQAVDRQAQDWLRSGRITDLRRELPFTERLAVLAQGDDLGMRGWDEAARGPALDALVEHPAILRVLQLLLAAPDPATGVSAAGLPALRFNGDSHLRPKLPGSHLTSFPWHQDSQYYGAATAALHVITVWLPLVPVDAANGCLQVLPGSQRWGLLDGERGSDQNIRCGSDPATRGTPLAMPMAVGDALFFHNLLVHGSEENRTAGVRWSLDLRYSASPRSDAVRAADEWFMARLRSMHFVPRALAAPGPP